MTEDQVVVGNEVEEPDVQLLCIVALRINVKKRCCKLCEILSISRIYDLLQLDP